MPNRSRRSRNIQPNLIRIKRQLASTQNDPCSPKQRIPGNTGQKGGPNKMKIRRTKYCRLEQIFDFEESSELMGKCTTSAEMNADKVFRNKYIQKLRKQMVRQYHCPAVDLQVLESKLKDFIQEKHATQQSISFSSLSCPICLDMLMTPCTTVCGHVFCFRCIEETLIRQAVCPVCRTAARSQELSESTNFQILTKLQFQKSCRFWKLSCEHTEAYHEKYVANWEWMNERKIDTRTLQIGGELDARDTQYIWCKAKVIRVFHDTSNLNCSFNRPSPQGTDDMSNLKKQATAYLIHYLGWNAIYDEVIDSSSQRLAPANFYTKREDIPHYKTSPEESNMRSRIDYGSASRQAFNPHRRERDIDRLNRDQFLHFRWLRDNLTIERSQRNSQSSVSPDWHEINMGRINLQASNESNNVPTRQIFIIESSGNSEDNESQHQESPSENPGPRRESQPNQVFQLMNMLQQIQGNRRRLNEEIESDLMSQEFPSQHLYANLGVNSSDNQNIIDSVQNGENYVQIESSIEGVSASERPERPEPVNQASDPTPRSAHNLEQNSLNEASRSVQNDEQASQHSY